MASEEFTDEREATLAQFFTDAVKRKAPNCPESRHIKLLMKNLFLLWFRNKDDFKRGCNGLTKWLHAVKQADDKADAILREIKTDGYAEFVLKEPVERAVVLALVRRVGEEREKTVWEKEKEKKSSKAKQARSKRKKHLFKEAVKEYWEDWQKDKNRYPSAASFAKAMVKRYGIGKVSAATIQKKWHPEWKKQQEAKQITEEIINSVKSMT